jgi:nicotinate-nucleotide--dimethylbenzimidazole phosphoribosyltransferase
MALEPLLDHAVTTGEAAGALLALPLVQAAASLAAELPERPGQDGPGLGRPDEETAP